MSGFPPFQEGKNARGISTKNMEYTPLKSNIDTKHAALEKVYNSY